MGHVRPGGDHGRRTLGRAVQAIPPKDRRRLSPCRRRRQGRGATALRCRRRPAETAESPRSVEGAHRMGSKDGGGCGGEGGGGGPPERNRGPPPPPPRGRRARKLEEEERPRAKREGERAAAGRLGLKTQPLPPDPLERRLALDEALRLSPDRRFLLAARELAGAEVAVRFSDRRWILSL